MSNVSTVSISSQNPLSINEGILCHSVNCLGMMSAGLAKELADKYPTLLHEYSKLVRNKTTKELLGKVLLVKITEKFYIACLFTQEGVSHMGKQNRQTNYEALAKSLEELSTYKKGMKELKHLPIFFPHNMGCINGGADWKIVGAMIEVFLPYSIVCM